MKNFLSKLYQGFCEQQQKRVEKMLKDGFYY
jgi:hypothetical protein